MSTTYYFHKDICEHCHRSKVISIGTSSAGWCFLLNTYSEEGINNLSDWQRLLATGSITNEYNDTLSVEDMMRVITERSVPRDWDSEWWNIGKLLGRSRTSEEEFHRLNQSKRGPNGLLRYDPRKWTEVSPGEGPWDMVDRKNFSEE